MSKLTNTLVFSLAALVAAAEAASAGDLLSYNFESLDGSPSFQASGVTGSVFDRDGDHFIAYSTLVGSSAPAAIGNGWDASAFDSARYFTFSLTADAAQSWNTVRLDLLATPETGGDGGPTQFSIRSSLDGFSTSLAAGALISGSFATETVAQHVDASLGQTIEYRVYAWGTADSGATLAVDNVEITTEITPVPEPASVAVVGLVLAAAAGTRRFLRRNA